VFKTVLRDTDVSRTLSNMSHLR